MDAGCCRNTGYSIGRYGRNDGAIYGPGEACGKSGTGRSRSRPRGRPGVAPHLGALPQMPHFFFPGMGLAMGIALAVIGVLAIVGGIYALKTKTWGLALAGSIGAVLTGRLLGVIALILIVLGRKDFEK